MKIKKIIAFMLCTVILIVQLSSCDLFTVTLKDPNAVTNTTVNSSINEIKANDNLKITGAKTTEILSIAQKYYEYHTKALDSSLKDELNTAVGDVNFNGGLNDSDHADELCSTAVIIAALEGDGDYALSCAAAAVGWSVGYARSANTLASVLQAAEFASDTNRLNDAKKLAEYAISLEPDNNDFYVILAQILYDMIDLDNAVIAVNTALKADSDNIVALRLKLRILKLKEIISRPGNDGTGIDIIIDPKFDDFQIDIEKKLEENDGELSKRDTKQEKDAENIELAADGDSKEVCKEKLNNLYKLEVITPGDMIYALYPEEVKFLREKIILIKEDATLEFPPYPADLFNDAAQILKDPGGSIDKYWQWLTNRLNALANQFMHSGHPYISKTTGYFKNSVDYMLEYNEEVYKAGIKDFEAYAERVVGEVGIIVSDAQDSMAELYGAAFDKAAQAAENGGDFDSIYLKYEYDLNKATIAKLTTIISLYAKAYDDICTEAQKVWEKMLPFARCTADPYNNVEELYFKLASDTMGPLVDSAALRFFGLFYKDATAETVEAVEKAEAAVKQYTAMTSVEHKDVSGSDVQISVGCGPVKLKLSTNSIEVEYLSGLAVRAAYNWKNKTGELGLGVGGKLVIPVKGTIGPEIEGKAYGNIVIDFRKNTVSDFYLSGELKAGINTQDKSPVKASLSVKAKVSLMGKGASLDGEMSIGAERAREYGVKHKVKLLKGEQ